MMDTKKLRQKILDLAIRGKLVPQDPNDEPAGVLLQRIREEKERLIKEGKIKRSKTAAKDDVEEPFAIPVGWSWCKLDDLAFYKKGPFGSSLTKSMFVAESPEAYKVYEQKNAINKDALLGHYFIDKEKFDELNSFAVQPADIIVSCAGTIGETYVLPNNIRMGIINQALMIIRLFDKSISDFYLLYFDFILKSEAAKESKGTAIKNIPPFDILKNFYIPLPPLAEQQRIANEIERWFSAIDELESNEADLQKTIDKAKSKILDLAIHGKLVPQDPNDEPAIELLKRINPKFEACENKLDTCPIPDSWCWAKLEQISTDSADGPFGSNLKKEHYTSNREVRIIQLSNIGEDGWREENTKYTTFEHLKEISRSEVMPNDIVIAKMMPAGRAILCPNNEPKYVLSSDAVKFHLVDSIDCRFTLFAINSNTFRSQVYDDVQGVTRVRTSLQKLRKYCIPLPPLTEQKRIVARLEELFAVLDSISAS